MGLTDKERMELMNLRKRVQAQRETIRELQGIVDKLRAEIKKREVNA